MAVAILSIWGALALFSLVDLQLGGKLYYSTTAFDNSVRAQFIHANQLHANAILRRIRTPSSPAMPSRCAITTSGLILCSLWWM